VSGDYEIEVTEDIEVTQEVTQVVGVRTEHSSPDRAAARELFERLSKLPSDDPERARIRSTLVELHLPLVEYLAPGFATAVSGLTT